LAREVCGRDHGTAEGCDKFFQPRRQVHARPDTGEVEPARAANIAVEHLAHMQGEAEAERLPHPGAISCVHRLDLGARSPRSSEHAPAHIADVGIVRCDRENGQQSVAHELQDFSAMLTDDRHLAIEIAVEHVDGGFRWQPVR